MKGDFSRRISEAGNHYTGVLHQQGRVWLDSDWNEDVSARLELIRRETVDVVGFCGVPEPGAAFLIEANPNAATQGDFLIGGGSGNRGRAYINGILCQMDAQTTYLTQPDLPNPPPIAMPTDGSDLVAVVYLEVWQRLITALEDEALREVALGGPDTTARIKTIAQVRVALVPRSSGSLVTCSNALQFLPQPGGGTLTTLQPQISLPADLCRLPDPNNFTGRQNSLYRVEIHEGGDPIGAPANTVAVSLAQDAAARTTTLVLSQALTSSQVDAVTRWGIITLTDNTGLSERAAIANVANDGRSITLGQGLTNAFTIANHALIQGVARFKWSRDNASFAVRVTAVDPDRVTLTLSSLGRDQATAFRQGDLVEICDDASELGPARGHLTHLQSDPDPDRLTVILADPLPPSFQAPASQTPPLPTSPPQSPPISSAQPVDRHLIMRRWDGQGIAQTSFSDADSPDMDLGDGVQIHFGGVDLLPGDYWQFTARSTDGSIEALTDASPVGIARHRSPLAVVTWSLKPPGSPPTSPPSSPPTYSLTRIEDCRQVFPALVELPRTEAGLHIQQIFTVNQQTQQISLLLNDSQVLASSIATGINVRCDADIDPRSVRPPACFLLVEVPGPTGSVPGSPPTTSTAGYNQVVLSSTVSAAGNTITWLPTPAAINWLSNLLLQASGILARFTLKGNHIWGQTDPPAYLDGEAYGFTQNGLTSLNLPSGDRRRGGDFEIWFWLTAQPVALRSLVLGQPSIVQGLTGAGTIALSAPATAGLVVNVSSSNPSIAAVPATVPFNLGFTSQTFTITGQSPGSVTITAQLGVNTFTQTLAVLQPLLVNMTITSVIQGQSATGTITLSRVADLGTMITLSSNNPNIASVAPSIPAGSLTTVTFPVATSQSGTAVITATSGNSVNSIVTVIKTKDKEKEIVKDKEIVKERKDTLPEKIVLEKAVAIERVSSPLTALLSSRIRVPAPDGGEQQAIGRAFIRSDERPPVTPPA